MDMQEAEVLAKQLLSEFGLDDWSFRWGWGMDLFGQCLPTLKTIELSRYLVPLNDVAHVENTIRHEIAHALADEMGHGWRWIDACHQVGIVPDRCYGRDVVVPLGRWKGTCSRGHELRRHCKPPKHLPSCGQCSRSYDPRFVVTDWVDEGFDPTRTRIVKEMGD